MLNVLETQQKLLSAALPPGFESPQSQMLSEMARPFVDEITTDGLGNIICHKRGPGKKIMLPAHCDVIGFVAVYIDPKGFIRFVPDGRHRPAFLMNVPVRFENGVRGTIQASDKVDLRKPANDVSLDDLYIDIGARDYAEASELIKPGDAAVFDTDAVLVAGGNMLTPYSDNLSGCIALLIAMEELADKQSPNDLYFVFTTQEERGLIGAKVAAQHLEPDIGIAVDVTLTADSPREVDNGLMKIYLGKGPTIKIRDGFQICSPEVVKSLREAAVENKIPYQDEILLGSGTDSAAILRRPGGAAAGTVSIPCRGAHSPNEMVNVCDIQYAGQLLAAACMKEF